MPKSKAFTAYYAGHYQNIIGKFQFQFKHQLHFLEVQENFMALLEVLVTLVAISHQLALYPCLQQMLYRLDLSSLLSALEAYCKFYYQNLNTTNIINSHFSFSTPCLLDQHLSRLVDHQSKWNAHYFSSISSIVKEINGRNYLKKSTNRTDQNKCSYHLNLS